MSGANVINPRKLQDGAEAGTGAIVKNIVYQSIIAFSFSHLEHSMAVISGLSHSGDERDARVGSVRGTWDLSWPLIVGLVIFLFLMNASGLPLLADPDTHWHIAVGDWIIANRAMPRVDTFSFTFAGQPWIAKEWLSQLAMTVAYHAGGWGGVTALAAAAVAATFALLLRLLLGDLKAPVAILFTAAALVMMEPHFLARPHVLAFPVTLVWIAGLVRAVEERRAPHWALLLAMLAWANLHGGFTLGLLMCGAFALDALVGARDRVERKALFLGWLKFGVASVLAACITPYGPESILVTLRIFSLGDALSTIAEWKPPNFQSQPMQELILLVALYLALSRGLKLPLVRLLIVLGLTHLFLRYARNAELLATFLPLVIAPVLARQFPSLKSGAAAAAGNALMRRVVALAQPAGRGAIAAALVVAIVFTAGMIRFAAIAPPAAVVPQAALDYARDNGLLKGRVFNSWNFGGPLIHAGIPTFIDGRGELYGGDFIRLYAHLTGLRGTESLEQTLDYYKIDWTLLDKDWPVNKLLAHLPGWRQAYGDDQATIFVRVR